MYLLNTSNLFFDELKLVKCRLHDIGPITFDRMLKSNNIFTHVLHRQMNTIIVKLSQSHCDPPLSGIAIQTDNFYIEFYSIPWLEGIQL